MGDITIHSETRQEFMGEMFYLCGHYFQHRGKRLHRAVWEAYNGPIPEGYHVHHMDENKANNEIDNLALLPGVEHLRRHASEEQRREKSRETVKIAILAAPAWHRSKEGSEWHSQRALKYWANAPMRDYICTWCGETYQSKQVRREGNHFCCSNCRAAFGRWKKRQERCE